MEAEEFLEKLGTGEFENRLTLHGLVKEGENSELQFSRGTNCEDWVEVPTDLVDSVDVLTVLPCDDHEHPYVRIELNAPETVEGELFASLLRTGTGGSVGERAPKRREMLRTLQRRADDVPGGNGPGRPDFSDCYFDYRFCKFLNMLVEDLHTGPGPNPFKHNCLLELLGCMLDEYFGSGNVVS